MAGPKLARRKRRTVRIDWKAEHLVDDLPPATQLDAFNAIGDLRREAERLEAALLTHRPVHPTLCAAIVASTKLFEAARTARPMAVVRGSKIRALDEMVAEEIPWLRDVVSKHRRRGITESEAAASIAESWIFGGDRAELVERVTKILRANPPGAKRLPSPDRVAKQLAAALLGANESLTPRSATTIERAAQSLRQRASGSRKLTP